MRLPKYITGFVDDVSFAECLDEELFKRLDYAIILPTFLIIGVSRSHY